ncbi:MAG: phenylalanine--tRNA ligase subunit beta [Gammaproteobacteria bacterium]
MKISAQWLKEWVNPALSLSAIAEQLTQAGLEVEALIPLGAQLTPQVKIGQVLTVTKHAQADKLNVCEVQVAPNEVLQIVCGANNVRPQLKVAVALIGAVLPGDFKIKQAKIRGVESYGMLCSAAELGLADASEGILELPADAPTGTALQDYLKLPDTVIEVNVTPNRGDCLSVKGLAREIAALTECAMTEPVIASVPGTFPSLPVTLNSPAGCPHYTGRVIRQIRTDAATPLWLTERLQRCGLRSVHPVVDVTNYVMLELGQPLHAFDLSKIDSAIQIRTAKPSETITLLDGKTITCQDTDLVIADNSQPLALAGIMGGAQSAVTATTTDLFLESAFFTPEVISPTVRRLSLQSDAAHRFERGVDPQLAAVALERATALLLDIVGGEASEGVKLVDSNTFPAPQKIVLRRARIKRILGIELTDAVVKNILQQRLQMTVADNAAGWEVTPPAYRFDLKSEIDLIEELARVYGYNQIPATHLSAPLQMPVVSEQTLSSERMRAFWLDRGYSEAINYSFVAPHLAQAISPEQPGLVLKNPISAELSVMRTSLWPGLLQSALFNLHRQQSQMRLFETGVCFIPTADSTAPHQIPRLAGISLGHAATEQWGLPKRAVDFFDLKGDVEALLEFNGQAQHIEWSAATLHPALHPGQSAQLRYRATQQPLGWVGRLHPELQQKLGFVMPVYLFELDLAATAHAEMPEYRTPSKFPSIRRDLALVMDEAIVYQAVYDTIVQTAGELLHSLQLFDVYRGPGIEKNKKSLALGLTFQLASRTLVDQEVEVAIERIIATLAQNYQVHLRA